MGSFISPRSTGVFMCALCTRTFLWLWPWNILYYLCWTIYFFNLMLQICIFFIFSTLWSCKNPLYCPIWVELGVHLGIDQILTIFPKFSNYTYFIARNDDYIYTMAHCMMIQFLYFLLRFSFILPFSFLVTYIFYTTSNVQRRTRQWRTRCQIDVPGHSASWARWLMV